jgi:hypothetical protein
MLKCFTVRPSAMLNQCPDSLSLLPLLKWLDLSFNSLQNLPIFPSNCPLEHLDLQCNLLDGTCTRSFENAPALQHLRLQVHSPPIAPCRIARCIT